MTDNFQQVIIIFLVCALVGCIFMIYSLSQKCSASSAPTTCPAIGPHSLPDSYSQQHTKHAAHIVVSAPPSLPQSPDLVRDRDIRVLSDPLYPPVGRADAEGTRRLMSEPRLYPTATSYPPTNDTYRLVGYLVNAEDKTDSWKLFSRQSQHSRRSFADFYAEPASKDSQGVKIPLSQPDGITSPRLRDIYDLPDQVSIKHPMFSHAPYIVVQLPAADLASGYY
jgi:hypothetical protein